MQKPSMHPNSAVVAWAWVIEPLVSRTAPIVDCQVRYAKEAHAHGAGVTKGFALETVRPAHALPRRGVPGRPRSGAASPGVSPRPAG